MQLLKPLKEKPKLVQHLKGIGPTYMDKTGRNGIRVGDIELADFKERYRALADKHEAMIKFYDVNHTIQSTRIGKRVF
jgi:adenylosuccinate synthase